MRKNSDENENFLSKLPEKYFEFFMALGSMIGAFLALLTGFILFIWFNALFFSILHTIFPFIMPGLPNIIEFIPWSIKFFSGFLSPSFWSSGNNYQEYYP